MYTFPIRPLGPSRLTTNRPTAPVHRRQNGRIRSSPRPFFLFFTTSSDTILVSLYEKSVCHRVRFSVYSVTPLCRCHVSSRSRNPFASCTGPKTVRDFFRTVSGIVSLEIRVDAHCRQIERVNYFVYRFVQ